MTRRTRLLIGLVMQAAILFVVVGGAMYNVFGIRDWWSHGFAHAVVHSVQPNPTPTASPR